MAMVRQKVGELLGLSLQAFDGATTLYPQAILRNSAGALLATLDLAHVGDGLYTNRTYFMPDNALLTAQYKVYSDAGHTNLDVNYEESIDVFVKDTSTDTPGVVDGTLVGILDDEDDLVGSVSIGDADEELFGVVDDGDLYGIIEDADLVGIVDDGDLIGIVEETS